MFFLSLLMLISSTQLSKDFSMKTGPALELVVGGVVNDSTDETKSGAGIRVTFFDPRPTDALITAEIAGFALTTWTGSQKTPDTDYILQGGLVFQELYHPMTFRFALGGAGERRASTFNPGFYYRAGLGGYLNRSVGLFVEAGGLGLFRERKNSFPLELGLSFQWII